MWYTHIYYQSKADNDVIQCHNNITCHNKSYKINENFLLANSNSNIKLQLLFMI